MTQRLPEVEEAFLAAVRAGASVDRRFVERVRARLDRAGEEFGRDIPHHMTVAEVLGEIRSECEDVVGWGLMALHVARRRLPQRVHRNLRWRLQMAGVLAAMADAIIEGALLELPPEKPRR